MPGLGVDLRGGECGVRRPRCKASGVCLNAPFPAGLPWKEIGHPGRSPQTPFSMAWNYDALSDYGRAFMPPNSPLIMTDDPFPGPSGWMEEFS